MKTTIDIPKRFALRKTSLIVLLGLLCLVGFAWAKQPRIASPLYLEGLYFQNNPNMVYMGEVEDWQRVTTTDCIAVKAMPKNRVRVDIELVQANAHMCYYSAEGTLAGNKIIMDPTDTSEAEESDGACQLIVDIQPNRFVLLDPEWKCKQFCGARASFDRVKISRSQKKPWKGDVCAAEQ